MTDDAKQPNRWADLSWDEDWRQNRDLYRSNRLWSGEGGDHRPPTVDKPTADAAPAASPEVVNAGGDDEDGFTKVPSKEARRKARREEH